jgi:integrase
VENLFLKLKHNRRFATRYEKKASSFRAVTFEKADDSVIKPAILLAATYGLRRSEVLGLTWKAVNFQEKTILINKTVVKVGTANEERDVMKSKQSRRTMPLTEDIADYLAELQARQAQDKLFLGAGYSDNDFICKWADGKPIKPDYISAEFKKLLARHGLPHIRFHDLRHSSASLLVNMGFTLKEIQDWLGHGDIASTNIYAHLEYKSKERMADRVSEALKIKKAV